MKQRTPDSFNPELFNPDLGLFLESILPFQWVLVYFTLVNP